MRRITPASLTLLATFSLTAAAPDVLADARGGPDSPPIVTIVATDFAFETPERAPAGVITLRLVNRGSELHHAQLGLLKEGQTAEDVLAELQAGRIPDLVWTGGPGIVAPGGEASVTMSLRAGNYVWLCFVESMEDHAPHVAKGMVRPMTIEGPTAGELPAADNTMMLNDYDFRLGKPLRAGPQVIRVRNYAAQPHEVMFVRLAPGRTAQDLVAWLGSGEQGPPPGLPVGGMQALSQGLAGNVELDLEPGEYALLCFIPDAADGRPHIAHGMVKQLTVE